MSIGSAIRTDTISQEAVEAFARARRRPIIMARQPYQVYSGIQRKNWERWNRRIGDKQDRETCLLCIQIIGVHEAQNHIWSKSLDMGLCMICIGMFVRWFLCCLQEGCVWRACQHNYITYSHKKRRCYVALSSTPIGRIWSTHLLPFSLQHLQDFLAHIDRIWCRFYW